MVKKCLITLALVTGTLVAPAVAATAEAANMQPRARQTQLKTCVVATGPTEFKPVVRPATEVEISGVKYLRTDKIQVVDDGTTKLYRNPRGRCRGRYLAIRLITVYVTRSLVPVATPNAVPIVAITATTRSMRMSCQGRPKQAHGRAKQGIGKAYGPVTVAPPIEETLHQSSGGGA